MAKHEHPKGATHIEPGEDDPGLHDSYGMPIPEPKMVKGKFSNIGMLAGHGDVEGDRDTWFRDSINENAKNQPKSHD